MMHPGRWHGMHLINKLNFVCGSMLSLFIFLKKMFVLVGTHESGHQFDDIQKACPRRHMMRARNVMRVKYYMFDFLMNENIKHAFQFIC
jgi:hypothetical protein